jgi:Uncharacterised protein family (UPF0236)
VARRSVAGGVRARQLALLGFEPGGPPPAAGRRGAGTAPAGPDWEERCYVAGCAAARELAGALLLALEAWLHLTRPADYAVVGWRGRTLVTRMGALRVRRRLYRDGAGRPHLRLDEHLGWTPRQVATPAVAALLVAWAVDVPFAVAAHQLATATTGVVALSGPTIRRQLRRVTERVRAAEVATHQTWTTTGQVPGPAGERVVRPLYVEADGVWVPTQREPAHRTGYELKCASAYEGWAPLAGPTPGHPRPHYALVAKQVYCHAHAPAAVPFWAGASLALHRTYDLSRLPLVVVGGDGANWIDTAATVFPRVVRQRDGFHLARDTARGWGPAVGATLYAAARAGERPTTATLLALPAPGREGPRPALPAPAPLPAAVAPAPRRTAWTRRQVARARTAVAAQVGAPDGGADWRTQVAPQEVPPTARALGTQEGTNAHLLARRMKRRGMSWTLPGAQAMGKARELVTNGTLAPWCLHPAGAPPPPPRSRLSGLPAPPRPWPQVACPAAPGPPREAAVAHLQRILHGGYRLS